MIIEERRPLHGRTALTYRRQ